MESIDRIGDYENTRGRDSHTYDMLELSEIERRNLEGQETNDTVAGKLIKKIYVNKIYVCVLLTVIAMFVITLAVLVYILVSPKPCESATPTVTTTHASPPTKIDGTWADWTIWGPCSENCGGTRTRIRSCTDPSTLNEGSFCSGNSSEKEPCYEHSCFHANSSVWGSWMILDSCPDTCTRTRRRSCTVPLPSYGETSCSSNYTESRSCYEQNCFLEGDYYISTENVAWELAYSKCEAMNASLIIIESQAETDFLATMLGGAFNHWIGMTCKNGKNCTWIDGRSVEDGFQAWAPGEPQNHNCVWIGLYDNKWDDYSCYDRRQYICELS